VHGGAVCSSHRPKPRHGVCRRFAEVTGVFDDLARSAIGRPQSTGPA
jgi:hypothetical protein